MTSMTSILAFLLVVFTVAGGAGLFFYRSSLWNFVDIVYYPLAAVGVALLFANNAMQRHLFDLDQLANKRRADLQAIVSAKPDVRVMTSEELVDASFRLVATISELAAVCSKGPRVDPQCMAAEKLQPSVDTFLKVARAKYASHELRLSGACSAAERLLDDIRSNERMSSLIGDELIAQYKGAVAKNYHPLAYDSVSAEAVSFEQRALGKVEWLHNAMPKDDSESLKLVLAMRSSEVAFGKTILQGLYPCIVAPKKELELLAKWTFSRQTEEQAISQLERDRQHAKESSATDPAVLWLHLNLWPIVLISALSLKFAKGVATVRKANSHTSESVANDFNDKDSREDETHPVQTKLESVQPNAIVEQASAETPKANDETPRS